MNILHNFVNVKEYVVGLINIREYIHRSCTWTQSVDRSAWLLEVTMDNLRDSGVYLYYTHT